MNRKEPPFGYRRSDIDGGRLVKDRGEQRVLRLIAELLERGETVSDIRRQLADMMQPDSFGRQ